jgi:(1->4)-alpha-D-glucan 1-alpha-D-glucosylmutase
LYEEHPEAMRAVDRAVVELNADYDALDELLNLQHYRLAYWRTADQELGYRRFFDVNSLVALRVERPHVFDATHRRILDWVHEGILDGVRVDHPDGLRDPLQYFTRLRQRCPNAWIVGEKILEPGESLRENWPIQGTSGYDFLNLCNGWLTHPNGLNEMTQIYAEFTHEPTDFAAIAHDKKLNVELEALGSDVNRLASLFVEICENNRDRRDFTRAEIRRAIREVAARFRVYRTYVVPERNEITDGDRKEVSKAIDETKRERPELDAGLLDFIRDVLLMRARGTLETEFVHRFQQFTSPVMAKGVEDTVFYCYNRMIGLNEVGSAPDHESPTSSEFQQHCMKMQAFHPATMTTLSTHDTKRSDDVRARLAVITEIPSQWRAFLRHWSRLNATFKTDAQPDRNTEYFLYQTMIGAWPIERDRLTGYMEKATREAKQQTSWTQQNKKFEDALAKFIERIYASPEFMAAIEGFVGRILMPGRVNSLAQTLLKCTAPGIPDTYQGSELWDLHLVDPDNRGPIDYALRQSLLSELNSEISVEALMGRMDSGLPKLWLLYRALNLRRSRPELFGAEADFVPLLFDGKKADHAMGYLRAGKLAAIVPRWPAKLARNWSNTVVDLPGDRWKNLLTDEAWSGGRISLQNVLRRFPVALLVREEN